MKERSSYADMQVNPCKMCMPMGASLAFLGIAGSMAIIHGSQGCSTYIRRHIAGHFNEPVDIASSSLTEEGTVYGGARNLKAGVLNLTQLYQPRVIGILTSCLAETIGDDVRRFAKEIRLEHPELVADLIPVPTPGYGGSQTEGYYAALRGIVAHYNPPEADSWKRSRNPRRVNLVASSATCADLRELKEILDSFGLEGVLLPDYSDALDAPFGEPYEKLNPYGTTVEEVQGMKVAAATVELGVLVEESLSPGMYLYEQHGVPLYRIPLPVGLECTDRLLEVLGDIAGMETPLKYKMQRGRLLDAMIDSHKHNGLGRAAVFGDMELAYGLTRLCAENGIKPLVAATGTANQQFSLYMGKLLEEEGLEGEVLQDTDFEVIRERILDRGVNVMVGNSDGKFIWEQDGIDLVRVGFPIHDHVGGQRQRIFGYAGAMELLDRIANTLLDQKHRHYRKTMLETYHAKEAVES
ncbi:nitrogenase component 1 [Anaerotalea alkaliphila]|uniref:Nitrogenase n=1 Tax=Anaerotalea alkaliphila TaxID=2662126 RepID=A0A7X5HTP9_9FIRM|nr:nitrogenase component 1 [Anaerotalea alkaliphila]NDL66500.1 nitrogenase [Anaerotalea alkaliphila]